MKRVKGIFQDETKRSILLLVISGIALFLNLLHIAPVGLNLAWIAIILCGLPIIKEAIIGLVTEFDIKADVLVAIALVASVLIGETFAAGEVAFIMQLGALLEDLTVAKARAGIEKLVHLTPQTARVISNGEEKVILTDEVKVGDILRVKPGEIIPADGIITSGVTSINQAVMTGESIPVDKSIGDYVSSGTVNQFGSFLMEAKKVGEDSSLQRMIKLVQSADAGKAKIVGIADRWATWIVCIALSSALLTWIITGEIIRAVTILVVFCPCALVLATPTAIMAAIGNVSKYGILVREGDALERLSKVTKITFDKTGTLTKGKPIVVAIKSIDNNFTENQLYSYLASAEIYSEHPLGKAIVECYRETTKETINEPEEFKIYPGRGVSIQIDGKLIYAGNEEFMVDNKILLSLINDMVTLFQNEGATIIYIAINQEIKGFVALADTLREDVSDTITSLHKTKVETVLLTGDNQFSAEHIASNAGITNIYANCLPEDKLNAIKEIQNNGDMVCMVGDGINDAPALKTALVGIAMGDEGSDIAVDAADIVLVRDDITKLPHLFQLSKHMMKTIKLNMIFSMALNFAAIILAITGILNPVVGALVHNAGSIVVIVNSSLLLKWKHSMNE